MCTHIVECWQGVKQTGRDGKISITDWGFLLQAKAKAKAKSTRLRFSWSMLTRLRFSSGRRRPDWTFLLVDIRLTFSSRPNKHDILKILIPLPIYHFSPRSLWRRPLVETCALLTKTKHFWFFIKFWKKVIFILGILYIWSKSEVMHRKLWIQGVYFYILLP